MLIRYHEVWRGNTGLVLDGSTLVVTPTLLLNAPGGEVGWVVVGVCREPQG